MFHHSHAVMVHETMTLNFNLYVINYQIRIVNELMNYDINIHFMAVLQCVSLMEFDRNNFIFLYENEF